MLVVRGEGVVVGEEADSPRQPSGLGRYAKLQTSIPVPCRHLYRLGSFVDIK